jgi:putative hydrolase of the HAD superfamily
MNLRSSLGETPVAAVLFEPYGTLLEIETDERDWYAYLNLSRFLEYRGVRYSADELRWLWFEKISGQLASGDGRFPEVDVRAVWRELIESRSDGCTPPAGKEHETFLTDVVLLHRALTRRTLRLMEGVRPMLDALRGKVKLGLVTDSQPEYILPELRTTGIVEYFDTVVISGKLGRRKPDPSLFAAATTTLGVAPEQALFAGVDTGRDIAGARAAGLRTVLVLTPYGSKDIALGEPEQVVDRTAEIRTLLDG